MRLLEAFFNAVKSAAKSATAVAEPAAETIAETTTKVLQTIAEVASKVAKPALQLAMIIAVGGATMLILPMILPMILNNITNIEQEGYSQAIAVLPASKPKRIKQQEIIENEVLVTPFFDAEFLIHSFFEQPIEQPAIDTKEVTETDKTPVKRYINSLNNQLALKTTCWQAIAKVSELLDKIKASELKSIASELQISKYRSMNKSQLMISIIKAQEEAPEFSC